MSEQEDQQHEAVSEVDATESEAEPRLTEAALPSTDVTLASQARGIRNEEERTGTEREVTGLGLRPLARVYSVQEEPRLSDATVSFHTRDENKDFDTHVTVTVRQLMGP